MRERNEKFEEAMPLLGLFTLVFLGVGLFPLYAGLLCRALRVSS